MKVIGNNDDDDSEGVGKYLKSLKNIFLRF